MEKWVQKNCSQSSGDPEEMVVQYKEVNVINGLFREGKASKLNVPPRASPIPPFLPCPLPPLTAGPAPEAPWPLGGVSERRDDPALVLLIGLLSRRPLDNMQCGGREEEDAGGGRVLVV